MVAHFLMSSAAETLQKLLSTVQSKKPAESSKSTKSLQREYDLAARQALEGRVEEVQEVYDGVARQAADILARAREGEEGVAKDRAVIAKCETSDLKHISGLITEWVGACCSRAPPLTPRARPARAETPH